METGLSSRQFPIKKISERLSVRQARFYYAQPRPAIARRFFETLKTIGVSHGS
jgi:hypothetical protein